MRCVAAGTAPGRLARAAEDAGFEVAGRTWDAGEALGLIRRQETDLLLADAVLPGLDGAALAEAVLALPLRVHPAVVLVAPAGLIIPGADGLALMNALLIPAPAEGDAVREAYDAIRSRTPSLPEAYARRLTGLMDALGVPEHPGRRALELAVRLAFLDGRRLYDMKRRLYPAVAGHAGMTPAQAERAMRYAIDAAWRTGAIEEQNRIFGDTIDARRGRPTCGEMIAQLADNLRWEGRQ